MKILRYLNMKNSFTLLEIILTLVISSIVIIYSTLYTKELFFENKINQQLEIQKIDILSTKIFFEKHLNEIDDFSFSNENLYFKNSLLLKNVKEFQHIRYIGEDIETDEILVNIGDEINFSKITLLASQGISHIKVYKKPKIVVFASGEELKLHYEKIEDYQIYNSNTPSLIARCKELGCDVTFIGQANDSVESITNFIKNSLDADLIITSGGVSVGDADFTKEALSKFKFEQFFDGIKIKPGKPTVFGKIENTLMLNLPGNPLASALIFELFGRLIIQKLLGSRNTLHNFIYGKLNEDFKTKSGRVTIIPGFFDGEYFDISNKRSPGMVSTLGKCNSMIVIDENLESIKKDSFIKILPINWKFFTNEKKDFLIYE